MAYQVKFTETTNPAKPAITVEDQTLNTERGVSFPGKNYSGYAPVIAENFLHLLENFASNTAPSRPVQGQLWFDNNPSVSLLKVYDGTSWTPAGSVKKAGKNTLPNGQPEPASSIIGDLWVDTDNQQLYLYSGSNWLLVGPQFSSGLKTGPDVETIVDTNNTDHDVITMWSENNRIAIISKAAFTPKQTIAGFTVIGQGVNLSRTDETNTTAPTKFWGVAEKANGLVVNGAFVDGANFLRSNDTSTTNFPLNIRNNGGITIGSDLSFNIATDASSTKFYSKTSGSSIEFKLNNTTSLHLDGSTNNIGILTSNPQEALDVAGNVLTSGTVTVTNTTDATTLGGVASITTSGGLNVDKQIKVGGDITSYGKIYVNNLDNTETPIAGSVILPGSDSANKLYDLGSSTRKFRNVYAESFVGSNFVGAFTGDISGIAEKAQQLVSATRFSIRGDVSSGDPIPFDGQGDDPFVFQTTIAQDVIANKTEVTDSELNDQLLIYRSGVGLRKTTKKTLISNIPTVPVGAIFPYAGTVPPPGYLFCDGSEVVAGDFDALFKVISYTYKAPSQLIGYGTFALPDLRGRFPLGRDDMDNGRTVPDKNDPLIIQRDAGGGRASRVSDVTSTILGSASGNQQQTIGVTNLPNHNHTLKNGAVDYFAVGRPGATSDLDGLTDTGPATTTAGLAIPNTGGVISDETIGQPLVTMNPYLTINYIIYTGVI